MPAGLYLALLVGLGVGAVLAWPLTLRVYLRRRTGAALQARVRLGIWRLYRGRLPPRKKPVQKKEKTDRGAKAA